MLLEKLRSARLIIPPRFSQSPKINQQIRNAPFSGFRGSFPGLKWPKSTTHLYLVMRLGMSGSIPLLPYTSSWREQGPISVNLQQPATGSFPEPFESTAHNYAPFPHLGQNMTHRRIEPRHLPKRNPRSLLLQIPLWCRLHDKGNNAFPRDDSMCCYVTVGRQEPENHDHNLLKTKRNLLYIRNQSVPRCKHFPPRL